MAVNGVTQVEIWIERTIWLIIQAYLIEIVGKLSNAVQNVLLIELIL